MSAIIEPSAELLAATRERMHPRCVVCGRCESLGLKLAFDVREDGSVTARFDGASRFEGYGGVLHGGVISAIADGAMTNCLFAHGIAAVTGELTVRFRHPIACDAPVAVTARIVRRSQPLYVLEARLTQAGQLKVRASGKFVETSGEPSS